MTSIKRKKKRAQLLKLRGPFCERCHCPIRLCREADGVSGSRMATIHHIIERKDGGTDRYDNLLLTCDICERTFHGRGVAGEELRLAFDEFHTTTELLHD